ncbi:MAG: hypothetical protein WDN49_09915 [Acetobacteraceae bacterium]
MTNQQDLVSSPIIGAGAALFKERFNRASFAFSHSLAHHPLLSTARLASLAERVLGGPDPQKFVAFNSKSADAATKFSALPASERLANTIRQLETSGSWLKLSRTQDVDPGLQGSAGDDPARDRGSDGRAAPRGDYLVDPHRLPGVAADRHAVSHRP